MALPGFLRYLNAQDIRALGLPASAAREAVIRAFRDHHHGLNQSLPKHLLDLGPGHGFQTMIAASEPDGIAVVKWVGMSQPAPGSGLAAVNATLVVNDYATGVPLAILDGGEITLIRTAAMSAAAASFLAPAEARTIGMVGCGAQAHAHLDAFTDLFPGLKKLIAHSRSLSSAQKLADAASAKGLAAEVADEADALVAQSDIIISMVPVAPGMRGFLDARKLKADAFVAAVDIGRSWVAESFAAFDLLATDSRTQIQTPYDASGKAVEGAKFQTDLVAISGLDAARRSGRNLFCFRGFALGDMALANAVYLQAQACPAGLELRR